MSNIRMCNEGSGNMKKIKKKRIEAVSPFMSVVLFLLNRWPSRLNVWYALASTERKLPVS